MLSAFGVEHGEFSKSDGEYRIQLQRATKGQRRKERGINAGVLGAAGGITGAAMGAEDAYNMGRKAKGVAGKWGAAGLAGGAALGAVLPTHKYKAKVVPKESPNHGVLS